MVILFGFTLNGFEVLAWENMSILEVAGFYGIEIPTLCFMEGLSPYGGCRLCLVEVGPVGKSRLVTSCTYPAREGIEVRTHSQKVLQQRRMLLELYVAACPSSKWLQDLASKHHVTEVRFKPKGEECILCGRCVRMCREQMMGEAIGYVDRGTQRRITTPFDKKSEDCRLCGGCMYVCPVCQLRCQGPKEESTLCSSCLNLYPPCAEKFEEVMCYMDPCAACELEKG